MKDDDPIETPQDTPQEGNTPINLDTSRQSSSRPSSGNGNPGTGENNNAHAAAATSSSAGGGGRPPSSSGAGPKRPPGRPKAKAKQGKEPKPPPSTAKKVKHYDKILFECGNDLPGGVKKGVDDMIYAAATHGIQVEKLTGHYLHKHLIFRTNFEYLSAVEDVQGKKAGRIPAIFSFFEFPGGKLKGETMQRFYNTVCELQHFASETIQKAYEAKIPAGQRYDEETCQRPKLILLYISPSSDDTIVDLIAQAVVIYGIEPVEVATWQEGGVYMQIASVGCLKSQSRKNNEETIFKGEGCKSVPVEGYGRKYVTWVSMLKELPEVGEEGAKAVGEAYPSLNRLLNKIEECEEKARLRMMQENLAGEPSKKRTKKEMETFVSIHHGQLLIENFLADVQIPIRGRNDYRRLGPKTGARIIKFFASTDPNEYLDDDEDH